MAWAFTITDYTTKESVTVEEGESGQVEVHAGDDIRVNCARAPYVNARIDLERSDDGGSSWSVHSTGTTGSGGGWDTRFNIMEAWPAERILRLANYPP